jgi:hypothetical protein
MEDTKNRKPLKTDLYEFIKIRLDNFDKSNNLTTLINMIINTIIVFIIIYNINIE